jgi:hypothetical protein
VALFIKLESIMKIAEVGFFHTPADWDELQGWISNLSGSEKAMATIAAMMAWNLAAHVTNTEGDIE